jgi:hypothetical protein
MRSSAISDQSVGASLRKNGFAPESGYGHGFRASHSRGHWTFGRYNDNGGRKPSSRQRAAMRLSRWRPASKHAGSYARTRSSGLASAGRSHIRSRRRRSYAAHQASFRGIAQSSLLEGSGRTVSRQRQQCPSGEGPRAVVCSVRAVSSPSSGWRWHLAGVQQVAGRVIGPEPSAPLLIAM